MNIDLSANLVLIHGRNGTGKTSLFDALEWALLGEVEHLDAPIAESDRANPFVNIFSEDGKARVSLRLTSVEGPVTLERSTDLNQRPSIRYAGKSFSDNRSALIAVLGDQARDLNIGSIRELVRSSSFLAQNTLNRFVSKTPGDRYAAVSHLLGTHDYAKFLRKLADIRSDFAEHKLSSRSEIIELESSLAERQAQLAHLDEQLVDSPTGTELDVRLKESLQAIHRELQRFRSEVASISINDPLFYNEIRAFLDVADEWCRVSIASTEILLRDLALAESIAQSLRENEHQATLIRADLASLDSNYQLMASDAVTLEESRKPIEVAVSEYRSKVQSAQSFVAALQQLASTSQREEQLRTTTDAASERLNALIQSETLQRSAKEELQPKLNAHAAAVSVLATEQDYCRQQLGILAALRGRADEVPRYRDEMSAPTLSVGRTLRLSALASAFVTNYARAGSASGSIGKRTAKKLGISDWAHAKSAVALSSRGYLRSRRGEVAEMLVKNGVKPHVLKLDKCGIPWHPLCLIETLKPVVWKL